MNEQDEQVTGAVCRIVGQVLSRDEVGPGDDFFALGGTSIAALQVLWKLEEVLGVQVTLTDFFDAPDLAGVAELIEARRHAAS